MRTIVLSTAVAVALLATVAPAQAQLDIQQLLQGLTTGNQPDDRKLRDAFERGYERGRQDEARSQRDRDNNDDRSTRRERDRYEPRSSRDSDRR